jgi:hypothetical protein
MQHASGLDPPVRSLQEVHKQILTEQQVLLLASSHSIWMFLNNAQYLATRKILEDYYYKELNSFHVMGPILAPLFYGGVSPSKIGLSAPS